MSACMPPTGGGAYGGRVPRLPRPRIPDGIYHVGTRGVRKAALYHGDDDRELFRGLLFRVARRRAWTIHAYCLMTNHYHLVVQTPNADISEGMNSLNGVYALAFNARHGCEGHVFERRFWSRVIESEADLLVCCAYVLENPVRAGLCRTIDDWTWSGGAILRQVPVPVMSGAGPRT
jgi:REP-associated tyrosine transposase